MNAFFSRTSVLLGLLLVLATFVVYFPAINGGLIMDDAEHITPPDLQGLSGLVRIWFEIGSTPHYYPFLNTVFWIEHRLWGTAPEGYHLINIIQHIGASFLVIALARKLAFPGAILAGFIFALHPVHVESVAWISEQKNTLSTLLGLASSLCYLHFSDSRRRGTYMSATALYLLALLTKTVVAVVPPALLVILWWRKGRLELRRDFFPLLPWILLGAAFGLFSAWFEQVHSHAQGDAFNLNLLQRTLLASHAIAFYARTLVWPEDLMFINPREIPDLANPIAYLPLIVILTLGVLLIVRARHHRGPLATYLLYLGMLFPVLGFLNINWFNFSFVANHFQHLPSVALIVPLAALMVRAAQCVPLTKSLQSIFCILPLIALAVATRSHAEDYRSALALYTRTVEKNPDCWLAHNNLGVILLEERGQVERAAHHFREAIRLKPDHARAHNNYATSLRLLGRERDAILHYRQSLDLQGSVPEVHLNLAKALIAVEGQSTVALDHLETALRLRPDFPEAALLRASVLAEDPARRAEAIRAYRNVLRIAPDSPEAANNLGALLASDSQTRPEALALIRRAVALSPSYIDARYNLGTLLAQQDEHLEEAIEQFRALATLAPDEGLFQTRLAELLRRARRP